MLIIVWKRIKINKSANQMMITSAKNLEFVNLTISSFNVIEEESPVQK